MSNAPKNYKPLSKDQHKEMLRLIENGSLEEIRESRKCNYVDAYREYKGIWTGKDCLEGWL